MGSGWEGRRGHTLTERHVSIALRCGMFSLIEHFLMECNLTDVERKEMLGATPGIVRQMQDPSRLCATFEK